MILKIFKQIIVNVVKRILNQIKMQRYASFVIYPNVQNVEINKGLFLRKAVIYQSLSDPLKKRMMMEMKIVTEKYARFAIENFILSKFYLKKTFKLNLKRLEF